MLWKHPSPHLTRIDAFRRQVNQKYNLSLQDYDQLHKWSVDELELFCKEIWQFCGVISSVPPEKVANGIERMWPRPQWFPGARLNYTENLLLPGLASHPDAIAMSACLEGGTEWRHLTWRELRNHVEHYASALKHAGIGVGDRVATVTTNSIETVVILLATGSIGAIFSSTATDMGLQGIVERYTQVEPKILFVDSEVLYAGKERDMRDKMSSALNFLRRRVKGLKKTIVVSGRTWPDPAVITLSEFLNVNITPLRFEQVSFDHPIYILYSSGTTGPPKCICHAGGAALLQQKKEFMLISDMGPESVYYQYTTTGWMMWNYLVGSLCVGARIVLYDGSPLHPSPSGQVQLLAEQGITHWGTSPKFLGALKKDLIGTLPKLEALQLTKCAGSPLSVEICEWFYSVFPNRVGLFNGSGGTDLVGGIVGCNVFQPLHPGELSRASIGMSLEIWDVDGKNIENTGERGELVVTKPFFSMPVTFWGKDGMEKYRKAYFTTFPGIWCHGDFIRKDTKTGGYEIVGRSDGVLNPGGVRIGTAELYNALDQFTQIQDYIAVGQYRPAEKNERILLFLKFRHGRLDDRMKGEIQNAIRTSLSARHVPECIFQVKDIPYTLNGKRVENVIKDIVNGQSPKIGQTIQNPECLQEYHAFARLPLKESGQSKL